MNQNMIIIKCIIILYTLSFYPMIPNKLSFLFFIGAIIWIFVKNIKASKEYFPFFLLIGVSTLLNIRELSTKNILKDGLTLCSLIIPVLIPYSNSHSIKKMALLTCVLGIFSHLVFSFFWLKHGIYYIYSGYETMLSGVSSHRIANYLYEPTTSFAAVYLILQSFKESLSIKKILYIALSIFIITPWFLVSLRMQTIMYLLIIVTYLFLFKKTSKKKLALTVISLGLVCGILYVSLPELQKHVSYYMNKLTNVGSSQKIIEFKSILNSPKSYEVAIGQGAGAEYYNPYYKGDRMVTHSVFSYLFLKVGILGLLMFGIHYRRPIIALKRIHKISQDQFIIIGASTIPIINGLFFQPTYRYLSILAILVMTFSQLNEISGSKS